MINNYALINIYNWFCDRLLWALGSMSASHQRACVRFPKKQLFLTRLLTKGASPNLNIVCCASPSAYLLYLTKKICKAWGDHACDRGSCSRC